MDKTVEEITLVSPMTPHGDSELSNERKTHPR